jgi:ribosomal protein L11 methyltransferase
LETALCRLLPVSRQSVRTAIRDLVADRELVYTSHYGCSFLEPSFNRPVRLGRRVVVKPPDNRHPTAPEDIVVNLAAGSAFGSGEHPTTRLAVRAMEFLLSAPDTLSAASPPDRAVLDVGTGTGILVIAAVKLGLTRGVGIDTDPCARAEARENIRLNRLQDRIDIKDQPVETLSKAYFMVAANLRCPTLCRLAECLWTLTAAGGGLILSGFRQEEMTRVASVFTESGFEKRWEEIELGWAGMAFAKPGGTLT